MMGAVFRGLRCLETARPHPNSTGLKRFPNWDETTAQYSVGQLASFDLAWDCQPIANANMLLKLSGMLGDHMPES